LSYKIAFKKSVSRDLKKLSKDDAKRMLDKIGQDLPKKADTFPLLTGKFAGFRKFRVGDYRVIYTIIEDTALILRISHRRDAIK
jgi:mRNA interferase RelE/StbE